MNPVTVSNNPARSRFEAEVNGDFAFIEYRYHKDTMYIMHTFVPESMRGQGIADQMARFALNYIIANGIPVHIYCPFVTKFIQTHSQEYGQLAGSIRALS